MSSAAAAGAASSLGTWTASALGGNRETAYGLCHLGDYEATLFSAYSHNRKYGECFVQGTPMEKLAEGYYTVQAVMKMKDALGVEMPICEAVYRVLFEGEQPEMAVEELFARGWKREF